MLISHHFHDCKAPLARASHVKWRYTKYLGFGFSFNTLVCRKQKRFQRATEAVTVPERVPDRRASHRKSQIAVSAESIMQYDKMVAAGIHGGITRNNIQKYITKIFQLQTFTLEDRLSKSKFL